MNVKLNVTSQTNLSHLDAFMQLAGDGAKIRGKTERDGSVTLYASHKPRGSFDWLARLFGGGRQDKQDKAQQAIDTILRNASGMAPQTHDRLLGNVFDDVPRDRRELRTEGLQQLVHSSQAKLATTIEFGGKTYTQGKLLGNDGFGVVHLFQAEDGSAVVVKRPKVESGQPDPERLRDPQALRDYLREQEGVRQDAYGSLQREIDVHRHVTDCGQHPHVMPMLGQLTGPLGEPMLVLPLAPKGDAFELGNKLALARERGDVTPTEGDRLGLMMLRDIGGSLQHLHSRAGVLHLDLKPENYLLNERGELQLMDFGTSVQGLAHQLEKYPVEVDRHLPPELAQQRRQRIEGSPQLKDEIWQINTRLSRISRGQEQVTPDEHRQLQERREALRAENARIKSETPLLEVGPGADSWVMGMMAYRLLVDPRENVVSPFRGPHDPRGTSAEDGRQLEFAGSGKTILEQVLAWYPDDAFLKQRIDNLPLATKELINGLLHPDPKQRMGLDDAMQNAMLTDPSVGGDQDRRRLVELAGA
ncbi:MAG TPA: hypothetical protein VLJ58_18400 [Ramlibacter sp.]|nr:hypothetical protein [Ramlibacter sp.]